MKAVVNNVKKRKVEVDPEFFGRFMNYLWKYSANHLARLRKKKEETNCVEFEKLTK